MFKNPLADESASRDFSRRLTHERLKRAGVAIDKKGSSADPDMDALLSCVNSTARTTKAPATAGRDRIIKKLAGR